ncbi:T9SS type A sorting domain-containing protein [Aquimarina pacifica]|uniref:T9SS type A sorting domain-containing protein n=1 Tax=Aquimarina pacifica TaxID=1296415 RepID=UPI0004B37CF2|nr:T9SS type A sorting domain-containing protein [Aquimarina pacifica]
MKQSTLWGVLLPIFLCMYIGHAQSTPPTCYNEASAILKYQADFKHYPDDVLEAIIESIESCITDSTDRSLVRYVLGLLYLELDNNAGVYTGIQYLELSSSDYHLETNLLLGTIYATGLYDQYTNWYKAQLYFSRALYTDADNAIANYAMGYIKLKNLWYVDYDNNDEVARSYFSASSHPMAKHWLAILYYYGIGGEKDQEQALTLLEENAIFNSQSLLEFLPNQPTDWISISDGVDQALRAYTSDTPSYTPDYDKLTGTYQGHLIEYDWALTGVRRDIPFTLIVALEDVTPVIKPMNYELIIDGNSYTGIGEVALNTLRFDNLSIALPRLYQDHPDTPTITYTIDEFRFKEAMIEGESMFIAKTENCIAEEWGEPVRNLKMVFDKTADDTWDEEDPEIPEEYFTITPNPFDSYFFVLFGVDLDLDADIGVYDANGSEYFYTSDLHMYYIENEDELRINTEDWPNGTYMVRTQIHGAAYTKTIVKETLEDSETTEAYIRISPNPFSSHFYVRLRSGIYDIPHSDLGVYDFYGNEYYYTPDLFMYAVDDRITIETDGWPSGMYIVRINTMDEPYATIIVKE